MLLAVTPSQFASGKMQRIREGGLGIEGRLHELIGLRSKLQWIVPVWVPEGAVPLWIFEELAKRLQIAGTVLDVNMLRRVRENVITTRR